jgi:ATP-dependent helicase/nuclease subunit B
VQIRFLLGPAGSGKTFRCLAEIRDALRVAPEGLPLILLAPKQATFQLERQLLANASSGGLAGYTRLHIFSFERLAEFTFEQLGRPVPQLLSEEGRVMVLRALLEQKRSDLQLFRASARLPGFARQLSQLLRELQHYHLTPPRLEALAEKVGTTSHLEAKLRDLAVILRAYADWLAQHQLEDADRLLDLASAAVAEGAGKLKTQNSKLKIERIWLDGFAQMTPQERQLLRTVALASDQTTLAFCLESEPSDNPPWHSIWSPVTETFFRCREELQALPDASVKIEILPRTAEHSRFQNQPMLQYLEKHWGKSVPSSESRVPIWTLEPPNAERETPNSVSTSPIRLVSCANPDAEVEFAAREIRRWTRQNNGRFRDIAVLLRSLDGYHNAVRRIFSRYQIPFFLDRRESVAHHPLAELTRNAIRLAAFNWEHEDWFGALKTGLVHHEEASIDRLENEALGRGWRGRTFWLEPLDPSSLPESSYEQFERLRQKLVLPFRPFIDSLSAPQRNPSGAQLGGALRNLWETLGVGKTLDRWSAPSPEQSAIGSRQSPIHQSVWEQMLEWLRNLELAFRSESLPLNEWLPIIEAGLSNLSVGAIPPALDQVLVGAIDRSRNPDLQVAFILGVNEGLFPAPPPAPLLLTRTDRERLASHNTSLGANHLQQIGLERYYGYIACTRPRQRLIVTYAQHDNEGRELNPSPFIDDLHRLFPELTEDRSDPTSLSDAEHWSEVVPALLRDKVADRARSLRSSVPELDLALMKWEQLQASSKDELLPAELAERIYGPELRTSVSGLEDFAACSFKFFIDRGLRAEERLEFEIDPREKGSFQHEILQEFHLRLEKSGKRWRDVTPAEARQIIRDAGEALLPEFRGGLFIAQASRRFTASMLIEGLERLIETLVYWTKQYRFDPVVVETSFGLSENQLPAWRIDLDGRHALLLRGRIDRIDLFPIDGTTDALGVIVDYKSSARELDPVLVHHGLELQLLAYLGALSQFNEQLGIANLSRVIPAGAFYVALKSGARSAASREEEGAQREASRRAAYQHRGRFDGRHLDKFDATGAKKGEQFRYSKNADGEFSSRGNEALSSEDFLSLIRHAENFVRQHGRDIYAGQVKVAPYRWKQKTACDFCLYRAVCRFDPWTQPFRVLRPPTP